MSDALDTVTLYAKAKSLHSKLLIPSRDEFVLHVLRVLRDELYLDPPIAPILKASMRLLSDLYELDDLAHLPDPLPIQLANSLDGARYRDNLRNFIARWNDQKKPIDTAEGVVIQMMMRFLSALPDTLKTTWPKALDEIPSTVSIPFYEMVPNLNDIIYLLIGTYFAEDLKALYLYDGIRRDLEELHTRYAYSRKKPDETFLPEDHEGPPQAMIRDFLGDTPFARLLMTSVPFSIPRETYASHAICIAPPRHGKTQMLGNMIYSFLQEPDPPGLFVLDPHGDLFAKLQCLAIFDESLKDRLVVLDPDTDPPALNFLDFGNTTQAGIQETFAYLMNSLSSDLSAKQGVVSRYLLKLLQVIPNASLETLRLIVDEKVKSIDKSAFAEHIRQLGALEQGFFANQFYSGRMQETKDAIGWKLYNVLGSDTFRQMFSAPNNSFDAFDAMQKKKVVLVKGARKSLGQEGMEVFLQFIIAQFFSASFRREAIPEKDRHLCMLIVDEAHLTFNSQTSNMLTECRKWGLGYFGATQLIEQIPADVKAAIYGATAIKIAGPVAHGDAAALAKEMYCDTEFIRNMKAVDRDHADFAFYVRGLTDRAVKVSVPYGTLENAPQRTTRVSATEEKKDCVAPQTQEAFTNSTVAASIVSPGGSTDDPSKAVSSDWLKK